MIREYLGTLILQVSKEATKAIHSKMRDFKWDRRSDLELSDIAKLFNPVLQGWINYLWQILSR